MSEVVFDASALLILLNAESGAAEVAGYIPGAAINTVNLSKVIAKLAENKMPEEAIRDAIDVLGLKVVPFDESLAYRSGLLRPVTKDKGLSLGDRACLALGLQLGLPVVTSDRVWQEIGLNVEILLVR